MGKCLLAMTLLWPATALAESGSFYGPTGEYLGSYSRRGPNTTYQGPTGEYLGDSHRSGRNTDFYGPTGGYEGTLSRDRRLDRPRFDRFERETD